MADVAQRGVYPNPSCGRTWTDHLGRVWHRRGDRGEALDPKRTRTLIRKESVPLVTWWAGEVQWYSDREAKKAAADALYRDAADPREVEPREWKSDGDDHMLMLEHLC